MAQMPGADRAWVPPSKVSDYLLNVRHPSGGAKARFLLQHGFTASRPDELEKAILRQAADGFIFDSYATLYGQRHEVVGPLFCPNQRVVTLTTVWQTDDTGAPRLVTLIPDERELS
jgi:hypothetical protein